MTVGGIPGFVYPTGTIGPAARQDVVGVYRGILAAEAAAFAGGTTNMIAVMRPLYMMIFLGGH